MLITSNQGPGGPPPMEPGSGAGGGMNGGDGLEMKRSPHTAPTTPNQPTDFFPGESVS